MFRNNDNTNPFGQSSTSPFGLQPSISTFGQASTSPFGQSLFGQTSNASTSPFAPKPFGSPATTLFGSQTGSSIFGGTSTGVFGQSPSPLATAPTFGSSVAPSFGASTMPVFGSGSSSFGDLFAGSSLFRQKPAFGGFGSIPSQVSFGSSFQQTQPAFGSSPFDSTSPFGAASQPAFGATSTPAFGSTAIPAFGATSTPVFGATSSPAFGATMSPTFGAPTTPAFGATATSTFGNTGTAFGVSAAPAFGSTLTFDTSIAPAFRLSTSAFGSTSTPRFGSAPAFGSSPFGASSGGQSSLFGVQQTTPTFGTPGFGQSAFGGQRGGSRVVAYTPTVDTDIGTGTQTGKLESISAMPAYKEKCHEELRWEDYQQGDKGGPNPAGQPATARSFSAPAQTSAFGSPSTFGQTPSQTSPFGSTGTIGSASVSLFDQKPGVFGGSGFGSSTPAFGATFGSSSSSLFGFSKITPSLFGSSTVSAFSAGSTTFSAGSSSSSLFGFSKTTPSLFGSSTVSAFSAGSTPSLFGTSSTSSFGPAMPVNSSAATGSTAGFGSGLSFGHNQSAGLFQSSPATTQTPIIGQPAAGFGQSTPSFSSNLFGSQSTGFGGSLFSNSTPSLVPSSTSLAPSTAPFGFSPATSSLASPRQMATPAQTSSGFSFGNFGQTPPAASSGFGSISNVFNQNAFRQSGGTQTNVVVQPAPNAKPFGTLPTAQQVSLGLTGPSISLPVSEKPNPVKFSPLVTPRHLSQRRIRLPSRKYHPKSDEARVPFFYEEEEPSNPKADVLFILRENSRALIVHPIGHWPSQTKTEKNVFSPVHENDAGNSVENNRYGQDRNDHHPSFKSMPEANGFHDDQLKKGANSSYATFSGNRAGEAAIVYEHGADIEALMPKLKLPEYYTEPQIQEIAAKERADPGFCCHVKDFVVGRHGYGSIRFEGETDVRRLDLDSLIQFNNREVIVYEDESRKPPVGQGLNKPAEVRLLNVKCVDKKTGQEYTEGPKVDKYKELLKWKTMEQDAEFVSYNPHKGEWKFKVKHFSHYGIGDGDLDTIILMMQQLEDKVIQISAL